MPIDFPNSPTDGQTFTVGEITWIYNLARETWDSKTTSEVEEVKKAELFMLMGA